MGFSGGAWELIVDTGLNLEAVAGELLPLAGFVEAYKWVFTVVVAAPSSNLGFTDVTLTVIDSDAILYQKVGQMPTFIISTAETMQVGGTFDGAIHSITLETAPRVLSDIPGMALGYIFFYSVNQQFPFLLRVIAT